MPYTMIYNYTKIILEKVNTDPSLFCKELRKLYINLFPDEIEKLRIWFLNFTNVKPELIPILIIVN